MLRVRSQKVEHVVGSAGNLLVRREHAQVGVELCRRWIVISRSEVRVSTDASVLLAPDQCDLAMRPQSHQTMEYLYPCIFQVPSPTDVRRLVKPGLHFHHDDDFLLSCSLYQSLDNRGVFIRSV